MSMRGRYLSVASLVVALLSLVYVSASDVVPRTAAPGISSQITPGSAVSTTTSSVEYEVINGLTPPRSEDEFSKWEKTCSDAGQTVPDQCLVSSVSSVLESYGPEPAVAAFKKALEIPRIKIACHTPSHKFGGLLYREILDIERTLAIVDGMCELGVIHGVFETWGETVSLEYVRETIPTLCASATSRDESFPPRKCAHGAGHAVWPASKGDLKAALSVCDTLGDEFTVSECGGGVTMSMLMGVGAGDPVKQDTIKDVADLCNSYTVNHKMSCITETGPMSLRLAQMDVAKAVRLCYELESLMDSGREMDVSYHCTSAVGYSAPQQAGENPDKVVELCSNSANERLVGGCLYGAIKQMRLRNLPTVSEDLAELCAVVPSFYKVDCRKAATEPMNY